MRIALVVQSPLEDEGMYFRFVEVDPIAIQFFNRAVLTLGDFMIALKVDKTSATLNQDVVNGDEPVLTFMAEIQNLPITPGGKKALSDEFVGDNDWNACDLF